MKIEIKDMSKGQLEDAMVLAKNEINQKLRLLHPTNDALAHLNALFAEYESRFPVD